MVRNTRVDIARDRSTSIHALSHHPEPRNQSLLLKRPTLSLTKYFLIFYLADSSAALFPAITMLTLITLITPITVLGAERTAWLNIYHYLRLEDEVEQHTDSN